jgi:hypothetical protein
MSTEGPVTQATGVKLGNDFTQKRGLLARLGRVQKYELIGISQLSDLVLAQMDEEEPDGGAKNEAWVASQFHYPLRSWLIKAKWNSVTFVGLSLVIVGGGFATSGITAAAGASKGSAAAWIIFAIGLLVALVGGVSQQFRFGVRADERRALANSLRAEGWSYVYKIGEYANSGASAAFRAKVEELQTHAAQVAIIEGNPTKAPTPPASSNANGTAPDQSDPMDAQPDPAL